jgi:hypothetical protein
MPYITDEKREGLDGAIEDLQAELSREGRGEGDLNYVISRLVGGAFEDEPRYHTIARVTGVLENVKQEFYRRVAVPYEDDAASVNGDINEYMRFDGYLQGYKLRRYSGTCKRPGCAGPANCPCEDPALDTRGGA